MARRMFRGNSVPTTLLGPITNSALAFTVASSGGSTYPDGSTGNFVVTLDYGAAAGEEKVLCSARSGDAFTVASRGYDGTAAAAHVAGAGVRHTISAVDLDEANAHINDTTLDQHTQYAFVKKGLAALRGAASRSMKLHYGTDTGYLSVDDGSAWHDFQDKTSADAAYVARVGGTGDSFAATGLVGSASQMRLVGANPSGAPTTGAHLQGDLAEDYTGKLFVCTVAGTPGTWVQVGGAATTLQNPSTVGFCTPETVTGTTTTLNASEAIYCRFKPLADITVTALRFYVNTASGNMDIGIYNESGGAPNTRLVSTGSFAVPATGLTARAITSTPLTGGTPYWLAFAVDNITAAFGGKSVGLGSLIDTARNQATALPLPATASATTSAIAKLPMLYILT